MEGRDSSKRQDELPPYLEIEKLPPSPFSVIWNRTPPGDQALWWIYIWFLVPFLIIFALAVSPWFLFCKTTRPRLGERQRRDPKDPDSVYEWYGPTKDYPPGLAFVPLRRGPGIHRRLWEMYGYFRETWHMVAKQGLQVGGVLCGLTIAIMQAWMMAADFKSDAVKKYQTSTDDDSSTNSLRSDSKCAYAVGTGIANWGDGREMLAWYACYHGSLILLCVALMVDETLNIRFGCFAPQWHRGGIGYTIMFLAAATQATSPNWGWKATVQARYVLLVLIFFFGLYNVLRTFLVSLGLSTDGIKHTDYRVGRKPLRFWTESEWSDPYYRQNFLPPKYRRYWWTERVQAKWGDWNFPLERRTRDDIEEQMRELEEVDPDWDDGRIQKVYQRDREDNRRQKGRVGRTVIHGGPRKLPPNMMHDLKERERIHVPPINPKKPPTLEEEEEMIKMLNEDKGYFGIANWKPVTKSFAWWWFDIRRVYVIVCGTLLFILRIWLCVVDLGSSNIPSYREQYDTTHQAYKMNHGPDPTQCQYYQGSSVALFPESGESTYYGGIWNTFLLGMCVAVVCVATSNNMWWGMHWPFPPITLIGPRMSSISLGWTTGFVGFATLQQGLFFGDDTRTNFARYVCYASVGALIIFLFPNEEFRVNYTRDPFWPWLSRVAFRFMDRKKWHYHYGDVVSDEG
ncbi:hypothetical protein CI109_103366 [Kwoniella shandongensis]|uniref:Uncharacterized protein n=1 Tax=Kwoniella shandongensis TaxID=1734106 RepID=A0AAJ8MWT0_9TREE